LRDVLLAAHDEINSDWRTESALCFGPSPNRPDTENAGDCAENREQMLVHPRLRAGGPAARAEASVRAVIAWQREPQVVGTIRVGGLVRLLRIEARAREIPIAKRRRDLVAPDHNGGGTAHTDFRAPADAPVTTTTCLLMVISRSGSARDG